MKSKFIKKKNNTIGNKIIWNINPFKNEMKRMNSNLEKQRKIIYDLELRVQNRDSQDMDSCESISKVQLRSNEQHSKFLKMIKRINRI